MQPIDYLPNYQNALQSIMGQVQNFQALSRNANTLKAQREQNRLATAINDRHIQAMNELNSLDFTDETALRTWVGRYGDLEYGKGLKAHLDTLDEKAKKAEIGRVSQVYSLLKNGRGDLAVADLEQQATAYENAGDKANADGARQMARLITNDPKSALMQVGMSYAYMMPKDAMGNYKDFLQATAPNVQYQDMGGYGQVFKTDPITGEVTTQYMGDKTQSPDSIANNELERWKTQGNWQNARDLAHINGGYNLQERQMQEAGANAREQAKLELQSRLAQQEAMLKANEVKPMEYGGKMWLVRADGKFKPMVGADGQQLSAGGASEQKANDEKQRIEKLNVSLDEAEKYLNNATGSGVGKLVDGTAHFFGLSTKGSIATAQLGTVSGQIVALMPKMSGPQSDKDVEMYKQMAGKLEDPTIPIAERKAALQAIRSLNAKYAKMQGVELQGVQPQQTQQPTSYASIRLN